MKSRIKHIGLNEKLFEHVFFFMQVVLYAGKPSSWAVVFAVVAHGFTKAVLDFFHALTATSGLIKVLFCFQNSKLNMIFVLNNHLLVLDIVLNKFIKILICRIHEQENILPSHLFFISLLPMLGTWGSKDWAINCWWIYRFTLLIVNVYRR